MHPPTLYSIGEVAAQADVSVQTLRHYHKLGLLEPSAVSDAGYRRYSEYDCARLKLIRTLRSVGFDLKTVARLLEGRSNARDVLRLQVAVLGSEIEALKRQQVVLNAVARSEVGEADLLAKLTRLKVLAQLDKLEREAFLARHLGGARGKTPQSEEIWRAAVLDLPQTMTEQQLEVWLELAELAADGGFQALLTRQGEPFEALDPESTLEWHGLLGQVTVRATEAVKTGLDARSETARAILNDWTGGLARILGREEDRAFRQWMLDHFSSTHDPRIQRYWQLVAELKDLPFSPERAGAFGWLLEGLQDKSGEVASVTPGEPAYR